MSNSLLVTLVASDNLRATLVSIQSSVSVRSVYHEIMNLKDLRRLTEYCWFTKTITKLRKPGHHLIEICAVSDFRNCTALWKILVVPSVPQYLANKEHFSI